MLANMRRDYTKGHLELDNLDPDPFEQFRKWFAEAQQTESGEINAMSLATATPDGFPSVRIVLLKGADAQGFRFFTNYESRKALEMAANPRVALGFYWPVLERQVRIEGEVSKLEAGASEAYFRSRPKGSQVGATISPQSKVITNRDALAAEFEEALKRYAESDVPYDNDFWGGYIVKPERFEFWQGRQSRLHDRLTYRREEDSWVIERLAP
ncbi:pyridoxamine 5'-phosphate oxidase [soil metagenome]